MKATNAMEKFFDEYVKQLKKLKQPEDVKRLYEWFWEQFGQDKTRLETVTEQINRNSIRSNLADSFEVQPNLPCLGYGAMKRLLVVNANPGWHPRYNAIEEDHITGFNDGRKYFELYSENFFEEYPKMFSSRKRTIRLWTSAMNFISILGKWKGKLPEKSLMKWQFVSENGLIGGWEIFPFHSTSDALTRDFERRDWLKESAIWSVVGAMRMAPEVAIVASEGGAKIINEYIFKNQRPIHATVVGVNRNQDVNLTYRLLSNGTELFSISKQVFSGSARHPGYDRILGKMEDLRSCWISSDSQPVDANILNDDSEIERIIGMKL